MVVTIFPWRGRSEVGPWEESGILAPGSNLLGHQTEPAGECILQRLQGGLNNSSGLFDGPGGFKFERGPLHPIYRLLELRLGPGTVAGIQARPPSMLSRLMVLARQVPRLDFRNSQADGDFQFGPV